MTDHSLKQEIIAVILEVWPELPEVFYGHYLYTRVRGRIMIRHHGKKYPYADTVMRYMRQLKHNGLIDYDVIKRKSIYIKSKTLNDARYRLEIYELMMEKLLNGKRSHLCSALYSVLEDKDELYRDVWTSPRMSYFPEIMAIKPENVKGYWWPKEDLNIRIEKLTEVINKMRSHEIKK